MFGRSRLSVFAAQILVPNRRAIPVASLLTAECGTVTMRSWSRSFASARTTDTTDMATETKSATPTQTRIVLVSGSTGVIGREIAFGAAKRAGVTLLLPVRDRIRGASIVSELKSASGNDNIHALNVDLGSRASIIALADTVAKQFGRLDVLINNAAIVPGTRTLVPGASDRADDGGTQWETQWGVNVESYYIMMNQFRPLLAKSSPTGTARIVNVASNYAGGLDITDPQFERRPYDVTSAYRAGTQARRMLSREAAAQFASDNITVGSCHPGVVTTKLLKGLGMSKGFNTATEAAATPLFVAFAPSIASGRYWHDSKEKIDEFVTDDAAVKRVWDYCKRLALLDDTTATATAKP